MANVKVLGIFPDAVLSMSGALIGKEVVLTLKNFSAVRTGPFKDSEPDTIELKGRVMLRPRGHEKDYDSFGFAVPFTEVPMRVVNIRHVVAINGTPLIVVRPKRQTVDTVIHLIKSSKGDSTYKVTERNGVWSCECVANSQFRKLCRHIQEAQGHPVQPKKGKKNG